ncbi:tripartite tricarboxylate transporter substrate binding protein [Variovorax sp. J22G73]|uniref:Bug family tripartite tricarboxylate transporter substrate binding protein n=1 Tax=unclassified Variovorax TaxID=663243 RepID=UPI000D5E099A|nr:MULTISPECIES: tripartite tricarboxylate transporter substrate binding protein [unclassified Variovorax]MDM0003572.1 tripartite tricarboxylate transporter substrate binding protein [Variovorax sp. J22R203]MDM0096762.1 tripartite tricarboxylate transporter substrate binding protein [Variovorax sp. J22G73]
MTADPSHPTTMQRRFHLSVLFAALTAFAAFTAAAPAHAQQKTDAQKQLASERFTLISPFPPGGPVDTLARVLSDGLAKRYGQAAVVDNQVGAAGNIGMEKVKRAKGDGHTLLVIPAGNVTINPTLMPAFPFDMAKDFVPITMLAKAPNVLVASPSSGIRNAKELVAQAKARPNTLSYASPGVGSGLHLAGELFKQQAGIDMLHVPYKGTAPALNDVLGGSVPLMFSNLPATLPFLKQGKLVAIGITEAHRSAAAPDIPTLAEQGIQGVSVTSWYGLMAPSGTPPAVVEQLAKDAAEMLAQPEVRERLKLQGMTDAAMKPAEFASYIRDETAVWARIIKARNIVAE